MKTRTKLLILIAGLGVGTGALQAQDQYLLSWRGTGYTRNAAGNISTFRVSEKDLVKKVATDNGLDPNQLALVYRVEARDTAVVWKTTGGFVADVIQLQYSYTDVPNANNTSVVREAQLNDEAHSNAIGSAFGTEKSRRDASGNLLTYSFKGNFQYAIPEDGTVYSGTFTTGKALKDKTQAGG